MSKGLFSTSDGAITTSSTAGLGVAEFEIRKTEKLQKTNKKIKDGTDGIDCVDEIEDHQKVDDWESEMRQYD